MDFYSLVLTTTIITMFLTPLISGLTAPLYALRNKWAKPFTLQTMNIPQEGFDQHLIIAGGGRVGEHIADVLMHIDVPFVVIEFDFRRVESLKPSGFPIIYGDASQPLILDAAGIDKAKLLLVTTPAPLVSKAIVSHVKKNRPNLHVVTRANNLDQLKAFQEAGVYHIVQPEFEAGLEFTRQALLHLDLPPDLIQNYTDDVHHEHYRPLYAMHAEYNPISQLQGGPRLIRLTWLTLNAGCPFLGKTIEHSDVRNKTGVTIAGVMRAGRLHSNPGAGFIFEENDLVGIIGTTDQLSSFRRFSGAL